jgi:anti-sigma B factor antagonist
MIGTLARMQLRGHQLVVGSVPVVALSGTVDLATVPVLRDVLVRLVADHVGELVAVDLDGVDVLDDTGLGVVLGAAGRARESGGELVVVAADPRIRARFAVTGLDRAIDVVERLASLLAR